MDDDDYDNDNDVTAALLLEPVASSSSAAGAIPWLDRWKDSLFLGITPTPEIVAILIIYFVEGALGLAQLAQTFLFKDELHLGPAEASAFSGLFFLPWTIKPLYGFLSDGFPLLGSKRRSYLILCGLVGCLADVLLGNNFFHLLDQDSTWILPTTVGALLMSSACIAFSDVVADGIVVQQTRDSDDPALAGGLQSLCWGSSALGGLLSAYFSGSLLEIMSPRDVFTVCAALPFFVTLIAFWINEPTPITTTAVNDSNDNDAVVVVDDQNAIVQQAEALWSALQEPNIWKPAVFMFLWQSTPSSSSAFLYFLTNDLGFGPEFLGRARLVTNLASLAGVWLYQKYLRTVPVKSIFFWTTLIGAPLGLTSLLLITHTNRMLGIPDGAFVLGDDVVMGILGQVAFLPTLVLAARMCPPGIEAVLFATLMSIFNASSTVGTEVGAALTKYLGVTETNFDNLGLLTIVCNLSSLYPLLLLGWLDEAGLGDTSTEEMEEAAGE